VKKTKKKLVISTVAYLLITVTLLLPVFMIGIQSTNEYAREITQQPETQMTTHETRNVTFEESGFTPILGLSQEDFLYDFDFLIRTLEENFPSFGIIYRRNGVDMLKLATELRESFFGKDVEWDYLGFYDMLRSEFFRHAWPVGHLRLVSYSALREDFPSLYFNTRTRTGRIYNHLSHQLRGTIWREENISVAREDRGFTNNRIITNIPIDGYVAYIRLPHMDNLTVAHPVRIDIVDNFFSEIEEFGHLIIDLRGHTGGWIDPFKELLVTPFIDEPLETTFHHFYMQGHENTRYMLTIPGRFDRVPIYDLDLEEIFGHSVLSEAVIEDLQRMDMYMPRTAVVQPNLDRRVSFDPKIWLLTDINNFSAAQHIAAFFYQTGFATLVGDTTGGMAVYMCSFPSHHFTLPNTGFMVRYDPLYIISACGRPWEYGTVPHHFNREGMDALQTVLAIIAEGNY